MSLFFIEERAIFEKKALDNGRILMYIYNHNEIKRIIMELAKLVFMLSPRTIYSIFMDLYDADIDREILETMKGLYYVLENDIGREHRLVLDMREILESL